VREYRREAVAAYLGSALALILGAPLWAILVAATGDTVRTLVVLVAVWFGITTWLVVVYVWQVRDPIRRLISARRQRKKLLEREFSDR